MKLVCIGHKGWATESPTQLTIRGSSLLVALQVTVVSNSVPGLLDWSQEGGLPCKGCVNCAERFLGILLLSPLPAGGVGIVRTHIQLIQSQVPWVTEGKELRCD